MKDPKEGPRDGSELLFIIICHEITTLSEELLKAPSPGVPWMSLPVRRGDGGGLGPALAPPRGEFPLGSYQQCCSSAIYEHDRCS